MTKIKAVIFDMDGVLIEAKDWHYEALNKALGLFGMEISRYDHLVTYDGLPTKKKLEMLSTERGLPVELHDFINEMKQQYTMEIVYARCKPRFFHEYALSRLKQEGYKLAVASNSIRQTVQVMMQQAALIDYLDLFLSNQDVKIGKPDPEIYTKAIESLGLSPQECLVVEDNEKGLQAAKASGAWLMEVDEVEEVNYQNIMAHITRIEGRAS
ncbi:HAD family hydrolase [Rhodoferax mekongensis]|uniref:HAD family phosphatase n=1 Tax=Rhodoferax mekongensis TaxID=3068341 RepID=A0ABZ0AVN0_9BURK|nr:HAD family phosphatase [Rhodoferax sp. TBRC 17307]WNO03712.1 HAD family phosphatase [Rhodoferax sp. TBRC 17307]